MVSRCWVPRNPGTNVLRAEMTRRLSPHKSLNLSFRNRSRSDRTCALLRPFPSGVAPRPHEWLAQPATRQSAAEAARLRTRPRAAGARTPSPYPDLPVVTPLPKPPNPAPDPDLLALALALALTLTCCRALSRSAYCGSFRNVVPRSVSSRTPSRRWRALSYSSSSSSARRFYASRYGSRGSSTSTRSGTRVCSAPRVRSP